MAIHVVEGPQRQPPALRAVVAVGEQAVVAEEHVNGLAIGDRSGRRRRVGRLILLMARARFEDIDILILGPIEMFGRKEQQTGNGRGILPADRLQLGQVAARPIIFHRPAH